MRVPIYRNLDTPFEIMGFSTLELTILCFALVGGGEVSQIFGIHRLWSFVVTLIVAISFFWLRRSLGQMFVKRLVRFVGLPSHLRSKLYGGERWP